MTDRVASLRDQTGGLENHRLLLEYPAPRKIAETCSLQSLIGVLFRTPVGMAVL